jgi:hypothetical protein
MSSPRCAPLTPARLVAAIALAAAGVACVQPDAGRLTAEAVDRDRTAREAAEAAIAHDHETLSTLIASDRFNDPASIYSDPELREVALHLIEQARKLKRLADSDVLSPGAP